MFNYPDVLFLENNNYPIPYKYQTRVIMSEDGNSFGFTLATNVGFAMSFVAAFYILFYIKVKFRFIFRFVFIK